MDNLDSRSKRSKFSGERLSASALPAIIEFDKVIIESNLGILRSVEFGAAKLHFD